MRWGTMAVLAKQAQTAMGPPTCVVGAVTWHEHGAKAVLATPHPTARVEHLPAGGVQQTPLAMLLVVVPLACQAVHYVMSSQHGYTCLLPRSSLNTAWDTAWDAHR